MAETSAQRLGELLRKLFEIVIAQPDGMRAKDALAALASAVQLTPHEAGEYPNGGGRRFDKMVRFATVDSVKAGWFIKSKGTWTVTEAGRKAYMHYRDPEAFYREGVRLYNEWRASRPADTEDSLESGDGGAEHVGEREVTLTYEVADEQAWSEIERFLQQMKPYDFQDLVADLLKGMGYHVTWIAPPGRDGGIDILAFSDPLGTRPPRIKVQVKRQQSAVSVDGLRSFLAVLGDDDVGIFVNTGGFTKDAMDEARAQARRRITLIDLERLFDLWVEHYKSLADDARRRMPLKPIYFLAPAD